MRHARRAGSSKRLKANTSTAVVGNTRHIQAAMDYGRACCSQTGAANTNPGMTPVPSPPAKVAMSNNLLPSRQGHWAFLSAEERFDEQYIPEPNSGCWLWIGVHDGRGYGHIRHNGRTTRAHRFSYERYKGPIPEGMYIDHLCKVPLCVNPDHLEAVSPKENTMRGTSFSARNARKTHCINGHPLADTNVYRHPCGKRVCLVCRRAQSRKYYYRQKKLAQPAKAL